MFSLSQSARQRGAAGEPLPNPFKGLVKLGTEFRRGEVSIVAAGAGTGKSTVVLNLAIQSNTPTLYFSADSTAATQVVRAASILTGHDAEGVRAKLHSDNFGEYDAAFAKRWWQRFNYAARPTPGEIELHLKAYYAVFNIYPHLVCIDNITNVDTGSADTTESYTLGLEGLCDYMSEMARVTHAHVMATHHVIGEYSDGLKPIPMSGIKGKISRVPSTILTIHKETDGMGGGTLHVSPVKNREGFSDPSGETYASFDFDTRTMRLTDLPEGF
ncbi:AAA family ATPase [Streptomyces klenkii]|uniref:AAA family ATPase n=1 Tax=Streptomyces klenkii TaxID=1420899 RepID=UPI0033FC2C6C